MIEESTKTDKIRAKRRMERWMERQDWKLEENRKIKSTKKEITSLNNEINNEIEESTSDLTGVCADEVILLKFVRNLFCV